MTSSTLPEQRRNPTSEQAAGPPAGGDSVELAISGMTCAACAARITRKLNKLDGVTAEVNYATERASVWMPTGLAVEDLVSEVERAGYQAKPVTTEEPDEGSDDDRVRMLWRRLVVALLLGVPLMDLTITMVLLPQLRFAGWRWVVVALALPVVIWCALPFHRKAISGVRHGTASMDTLVSLGIAAASCWSLFTIFTVDDSQPRPDGLLGLVLQPAGSVYLEVAAGVTIFVLAGRLFEARAKRAAAGALRSLALLGARDVAILRADGVEERVPVARLGVGDRFVVRPGETIATDGTVVDGASAVDASAMTGESTPVEVGRDDAVTGGTVAVAGRLVVRADRVGSATQLAQLVRLVERAQSDKANIQRIADRISGYFVPAVLVLAVATIVTWLLIGGSLQAASLQAAISAGLAVLIIACPCALGLATPTALMAASGRGAQLGVFIKGHQALESARAVDTVVLDKTGTVTTGRMSVHDMWTAADADRVTVLAYAGAVEDASEHAIAYALKAFAKRELGELPPVDDFASLAGLGATGRVDGAEVLVGSARLVREQGIAEPAELVDVRRNWEAAGRTCVLVARDGAVVGAFALADTVKPSAEAAITELRRMGLRTVLLTGDTQATADAVGGSIGVDEVIAEVLPADKADMIERLQRDGATVAMVGDGVNDAPALARADLGMAMITGTDVALGAADMILVRDELSVVPTAVLLARRTLRTIRGNLLWAFGYNVAALPVAALGLLNPLIAGGAMALSSLLVVSNSARLRGFGRTTGRD